MQGNDFFLRFDVDSCRSLNHFETRRNQKGTNHFAFQDSYGFSNVITKADKSTRQTDTAGQGLHIFIFVKRMDSEEPK